MRPLKHAYSIAPVDNWIGWDTYEEFVAKLAQQGHGAEDGRMYVRMECALIEVDKLYAQAATMARNIGWEGDHSVGPCFSVLPLPNDYDVAPIVAWKQSNNGATFVMSAFPLPYLEGL